jgi:hypothetical protein
VGVGSEVTVGTTRLSVVVVWLMIPLSLPVSGARVGGGAGTVGKPTASVGVGTAVDKAVFWLGWATPAPSHAANNQTRNGKINIRFIMDGIVGQTAVFDLTITV